jgi:NADH-quinone oxidoreductase subunit N
MLDNVQSLYHFAPESVLAGGILLTLLADLVLRRARPRILGALALLALAGAATATLITGGTTRGLFGGLMARDPFADFFKLLGAGVGALAVIMSLRSDETIEYRGPRPGGESGEFFALLLATVLGMNLMASATDLLTAYLALELVSLTSYVLAGYRRGARRSAEAALKYVIYGGVASGVMLYGFSLLYGFAGATSLDAVRAAAADMPPALLLVAAVMILAGFGYKVAAVPFHMWCPDVYEGAPTPVTAFLSVGPKAAGFALLLRVLGGILPGLGETGFAEGTSWPMLLATVATATMTLGNLAALWQQNVKRLLAYSSIAHAGYLLMGVAVFTASAERAVLFYLVAYLFMNVGAFVVVQALAEAGQGETVAEWRGMGYRAPFAAVVAGLFLFSLTGLPPTVGFVGKFYLFAAVIERGGPLYVTLAIVGVLNSAISLYFYARILKAMFLEPAPEGAGPVTLHPLHAGLLGALALPVLALGIYWSPLAAAAESAIAQWSAGALGAAQAAFQVLP